MNEQGRKDLWIRCPRLGGEAPFSYCLREGGDLPCARVVSCWQPYFPVEQVLMKIFPGHEWEEFINRKPKEKMASLLELVEEAKRTIRD